MAACVVHYNCDFGLVVRYLGSEYMAKWRDTKSIMGAVKSLVLDTDLGHICRILTL